MIYQDIKIIKKTAKMYKNQLLDFKLKEFWILEEF